MKIICFHLNQIGDFAFSLPALKCIRDSFPDATITSVVRPAISTLLSGTGLVDQVLLRGNKLNLHKAALIKRIMADRYDLAVVFSQSAECAVLAYLGGAKRRVGFVNTTLGSLLTERVDFIHPPSTENNLRLVSKIGGTVTCNDYSGLLKLNAEQIAVGDVVLYRYGIAPDDKIVGFAPGTSGRRSVKEWTDEGYAEVARYFSDRGCKVVVVGTDPAAGIVNHCDRVVDLSCKTNLVEAAAILFRCSALLAVDSGMLHLAAAMGKRVVGLYGPSNSKVTGPQGSGHVVITSDKKCSPCMQTMCKLGRECMTDIDTNWVIAAIEEIVQSYGI